MILISLNVNLYCKSFLRFLFIYYLFNYLLQTTKIFYEPPEIIPRAIKVLVSEYIGLYFYWH